MTLGLEVRAAALVRSVGRVMMEFVGPVVRVSSVGKRGIMRRISYSRSRLRIWGGVIIVIRLDT